MNQIRRASIVVAAVLLSGCYHAVIETGRPAGSDLITNKWAHSFIYGLVPPQVVNTAARCPSGVAKVETQHSFLNGLAAAVTFGIYTPIQIDVTCATGGTASISPAAPTVKVENGRSLQEVLDEAVQLSSDRDVPVFVQF